MTQPWVVPSHPRGRRVNRSLLPPGVQPLRLPPTKATRKLRPGWSAIRPSGSYPLGQKSAYRKVPGLSLRASRRGPFRFRYVEITRVMPASRFAAPSAEAIGKVTFQKRRLLSRTPVAATSAWKATTAFSATMLLHWFHGARRRTAPSESYAGRDYRHSVLTQLLPGNVISRIRRL